MERKEYSQVGKPKIFWALRDCAKDVCEKIIYSRPKREIRIETSRNEKGYSHKLLLDGVPFEIPEDVNADKIETYKNVNQRELLHNNGIEMAVSMIPVPPKKRFEFI